METFDLKPDAPTEYRGEFRPIPTSASGLSISEHLPKLARLGDKIAVIRSCHHDSPGHVNSTHTMTTGYPGELVETPPYHPKHPDFWAVSAKVQGSCREGMPAHVALPSIRYQGAAYLGTGLGPLPISADPNQKNFRMPSLSLAHSQQAILRERLSLREKFDHARRQLDHSGVMASLDQYDREAVSILTSPLARQAFDLSQEHPRVRERYGRHTIGQRCLLARRLIEAGSRLVTVDFPHVPGQKAFSWDDHASVWNIFEQMKIRLPILDQVMSALIEDLYERGLDKDCLLVVMGEMSHTPRISYFQGNPGREHWSQSMSIVVAGGGLRMGQAIGSTNQKGEEPRDRPLAPNDILATWYKHLGVPLDLQFRDHFGRPTPIVPHGEPIAELF